MAVSRIYLNESADGTSYGVQNKLIGTLKSALLSICPALTVESDNDPSGGTTMRNLVMRIGTFPHRLRLSVNGSYAYFQCLKLGSSTASLTYFDCSISNTSYITLLGSSKALTFTGAPLIPFFAEDFEGDWVAGIYYGSNGSFNMFVGDSDAVHSQAVSTACGQSIDVTGKKLLQPFRLVAPTTFLTKHKFPQVFRSTLAEGFYSDPNGNKYFVTSNYGGRNVLVSDL